jgi:hypothetical protein
MKALLYSLYIHYKRRYLLPIQYVWAGMNTYSLAKPGDLIDLAGLISGVYLIIVSGGEDRIITRIIKAG